MDRRSFLKLAGMMAAGPALRSVPIVGLPDSFSGLAEVARPSQAALSGPTIPLSIQEPGVYRISGLVRLEAPLVEISGLTHSQSISWSGGAESGAPVASFVSFERFDSPGFKPQIQVQGGRLEALTAVPLD